MVLVSLSGNLEKFGHGAYFLGIPMVIGTAIISNSNF